MIKFNGGLVINQLKLNNQKRVWYWVGGWVGEWKGGTAGLRIAYSNNKLMLTRRAHLYSKLAPFFGKSVVLDGWMDGWYSRFKDCLQQLKNDPLKPENSETTNLCLKPTQEARGV